MLSGKGLCDELITRPEVFYRLWCVVVCDLETLLMRRPWPTGGLLRQRNVIGVWKETLQFCVLEDDSVINLSMSGFVLEMSFLRNVFIFKQMRLINLLKPNGFFT